MKTLFFLLAMLFVLASTAFAKYMIISSQVGEIQYLLNTETGQVWERFGAGPRANWKITKFQTPKGIFNSAKTAEKHINK